MLKGKISISNPTPMQYSAKRIISIEMTDELSGVLFLSIELSPEDFMNALTGRADKPCEFELRGMELVGKRQETKHHELVSTYSWLKKEQILEDLHKAAKSYEVDGWQAMINPDSRLEPIERHKDGTALFDVSFFRYVDVQKE